LLGRSTNLTRIVYAFDMVVLNALDRFHLAQAVIVGIAFPLGNRVPQLQCIDVHAKQLLRNKLIDHRQYITKRGEAMPEILNWQWSY